MHGLLPAQRAAAQPPRDYHTNTNRESSCSQPDQAPPAGSLSVKSGGNPQRLGHCCKSARDRGNGSLRETGHGIVAGHAQAGGCHTLGGASARLKSVALALIRFYQSCLSPALPSACRYYPSCSAYAYEAVEKWGAWRGAQITLGRLLRCRPWGGHGFDPVP